MNAILGSNHLQWLRDKLSAVDFLASHSDEEREKLVQAAKNINVMGGQLIVKQGQKLGAYYLIFSGAVEIWGETAEGNKKLAALNAGDAFGEVSILTGDVCNATVRAKNDTELLAVPAEALRRVAQINPKLAETMAEAVAKRKGVKALGLDPKGADQKQLAGRIKSFLRLTSMAMLGRFFPS